MSMLTKRALLAGAAAAIAAPALARGERFAQAARYSADRRGVSLLVTRAGKTLFEDYPNEGGRGRAWELASGTKSFSGLMAAAAASDRLLSLDEACAATLPEWRDDPRKSRITIRQLLTLTSGIRSGFGRSPAYAQAIAAEAAYEPGTRFAYGQNPFSIFGEILRRKLAASGREADPVAYVRRRVLDPAGVRVGAWRRGPDDNPILAHGASLTARDWARFGQAVFEASRGGAAGLDARTLAACFEGTSPNPGYGLTWWLLRPGLISPGPRAGVDGALGARIVAEDVVMAAGAGDQRLYLIRSRGLIVARQASGVLAAMIGQGTGWRDEVFLNLILADA